MPRLAALMPGSACCSGGGANGSGGGGATAYSGFSGSTTFLPTPAAGAPAQRRLPPLTPTAELGAERRGASMVR